MLTKLKLALALAAPLVAGAATYAAAHGPDRKAEMIQKFDQNADGALDDAERAKMKEAFAAKRAAHHQEMLTKFDANRDGALDKTERLAMRDAKATERFQKLDKNADGVLSLDEFKAGKQRGHARHGHHEMRGFRGGDRGPAE